MTRITSTTKQIPHPRAEPSFTLSHALVASCCLFFPMAAEPWASAQTQVLSPAAAVMHEVVLQWRVAIKSLCSIQLVFDKFKWRSLEPDSDVFRDPPKETLIPTRPFASCHLHGPLYLNALQTFMPKQQLELQPV